MRTVTANELAQLSSQDRATHLKVEVYESSAWHDVSELYGSDFLIGASFSETASSQVAQATILVGREDEGVSLSPMMYSSAPSVDIGTLLDIGNDVRVHKAVTGMDQTPESGEWRLLFEGFIQGADWSKSPITLNCLDPGGKLARIFIENIELYGSVAGKPIEEVIQDILDDHASGTTLYSENGTGGTPWNPGDSPGWSLGEYKQSKDHVLPAIRKLAQQIGYDCKYKWHENTGAHQLQLFVPERSISARGTLSLTGLPANNQTFDYNATTFTAKTSGAVSDQFNIGATEAETCDNIVAMLKAGTEADNVNAWRESDAVVFEYITPGTPGNAIVLTEALSNATADGSGTLGGTRAGSAGKTTPDHTFAPEDYENISRAFSSIDNLRNKVMVVYDDAAAEARTHIVVKDTASISKYGTIYMEVTEKSSSQIDTGAEATDYANAILNDLAKPDVDMTVTLPYFWPAQVGDLYRFEANGVHFDTDQDLAVVAIREVFKGNRAASSFQVRGKPSGGAKRWLNFQGMPGVAPPVDEYGDAAPSSVVASGTVGGIEIVYDDPRAMSPPVPDWAYTECHVGSASSFTPDASTLKAKGKTTRFIVGDLVPGATYYAKLIIYDDQNNQSGTSTYVVQATQMVGAYHEDPDRIRGNMIANGEFGQATLDLTTTPPDGWTMKSIDEWGAADDVYYSTALQETGQRSLHFRNTGSGVTFDAEIRSDLIPSSHRKLYRLTVTARVSDVTKSLQIDIQSYSQNKASLSTLAVTTTTLSAANVWETLEFYGYFGSIGDGLLISSQRFMEVRLIQNANPNFDLYIDRAVLTYAMQSFRAYRSTAQSIPDITWTRVLFFTQVFDHGGATFGGSYGYDPSTAARYRVLEDGQYAFEARIGLAAMPDQGIALCALYVNGVNTIRGEYQSSSGTNNLALVVAGTLDLVKNDYVQVYVYQLTGGAISLMVGATETWFSGGRVE